MICPKCGKDLGDSNFCQECGVKYDEEKVIEKPAENNEPVNAVPADENGSANYYEALKRIEEEKKQEQKKKSRKKAIGCGSAILILILILAVLGIINRSKSNNKSSEESSSPSIEINISPNDATTETTESTTAEVKTWYIKHYVDDFKEEIADQWYVEGVFYGTFSNSATTNSKCSANVVYDYDNRLTFFLFDYGTHQLKNSYSSKADYYTVKYKDSKGTIRELSAYIPAEGDRMFINDFTPLLEAIKTGNVSIQITDNKYSTNVYNFVIESDNFTEILTEVK